MPAYLRAWKTITRSLAERAEMDSQHVVCCATGTAAAAAWTLQCKKSDNTLVYMAHSDAQLATYAPGAR